MSADQVAFGILMGIGLLWLLLSVFLGDISDALGGGAGAGGMDTGTDAGDVDAGSTDAGGTDAGSDVATGDADGGAAGDSDLHGASWTSSSVIATALTGIGGSGLAATSLGLAWWLAIPFAIVIGLLFAYLVMRYILRPLLKQQANTALSERTYLGTRATVTLEVAEGRTGAVRFTDLNDAIVEMPAVPKNPADRFARGDVVVIHSVVSGKARVIAFDAP